MNKPDNTTDKPEATNLTDEELTKISGGQAAPDKDSVKALPINPDDMCKGGGPRVTVFDGKRI